MRLWRWSNEHRVRSTALRCSPIARRRELSHPWPQTCAPCPRDRLRFSAPPKALLSLHRRPSMASFGARPDDFASPYHARMMRPSRAPRTRRANDGKVRRMAHRKCASSPLAQGCAFGEPRRPLANPEHMDVLRTCSRGGLLYGDFLLTTQEKVTRAPGMGTEKNRDATASEGATP